VLRTASVSIERSSAFVIEGCLVVDAFHWVITFYMGTPERKLNPHLVRGQHYPKAQKRGKYPVRVPDGQIKPKICPSLRAKIFLSQETNFSQRVNCFTDRNKRLPVSKGGSGTGRTAPHF
jgi:hypothetical protein